MSKLSDRFKKADETEVLNEKDELRNNLLEKVNSVPYWNEYEPEKQRDMVRNFVENSKIEDKEPVCESLLPIVTGFGPLQNLLDNEKVSAVFINGTNSVHIEIDGKVFNAEMNLTESMLQYVLNIAGNSDKNIYSCKVDNYAIDVIKPDVSLSGVNISIRKIKDYDIDMPKNLFRFLTEQITNKKRIVVAGDINSGKSTLLNQLIKTCLSDKRCYLLEKSEQISAKSDFLVKLDISKCDYDTLISIVQKSNPEYVISDLNLVNDDAQILTLRANSLDGTFRTLVAKYSEMSEKYAKLKVLNDFDYIVYMKDFKIVSVAELKPAKTMALSINILFEA